MALLFATLQWIAQSGLEYALLHV